MRVNAKRIARALGAVADLVEVDPIYVPIFERLSDELVKARQIEAARALKPQSS
jgi:hypothetical protein